MLEKGKKKKKERKKEKIQRSFLTFRLQKGHKGKDANNGDVWGCKREVKAHWEHSALTGIDWKF